MKLYSAPLSLFSRKVEIALREKEIDFEREMAPFTQAQGYEPRHPVVLAINPKRQVPVLIDGDLALFDSTLIFEYLEDLRPVSAAIPGRHTDAGALSPIRANR
jgi:glutathione S-transferase